MWRNNVHRYIVHVLLCSTFRSFFESHPLLESIKDYGGVLSIAEIWKELAKLELDDWKMVVDKIPKESESGGRFGFYHKIKTSHGGTLHKRRIITLDLVATVPQRCPLARRVALISAQRPTFCCRVPLLSHPEKT